MRRDLPMHLVTLLVDCLMFEREGSDLPMHLATPLVHSPSLRESVGVYPRICPSFFLINYHLF